MRKQIAAFTLVLLLAISVIPVSAQTPTPPAGPVYIVQDGDTLWDIASRFNVNVNDLQAINNLSAQDIFVGDILIIPGLEGLSGTLIIKPVPFGETLQSLSQQYQMDTAALRKLNHIVSPTQLYAGYNLIVLKKDDQTNWTSRTNLGQGETLLELAVKGDSDPWTLAQINGLAGPAAALPGDILYLPSGDSTATPTGLPSVILSATVDTLPLTQGDTAQIKITTSQSVTLGGLLIDHPLNFFTAEDGSQVALQGIHAMTDPGLYPLRMDVTLPDGSVQSFEQMILVQDGNFIQDPVLIVDQVTIDPAVTEPENELLLSYTKQISQEKYWDGVFQTPVDVEYCLRSLYGNRRSYNNSDYIYFHTGVDYGVCSKVHPFDVYAPAAGVVVYTGLLTVRGNATIIDHGQGIYSGLWHQEEIYVSVGDHVAAGQLIGKIGATGRVTGSHLHWDLWVNGIQVDPLRWLNEAFPH
ncbi:MAG: LysM peptidoglycan-binding domain-containing protein [Chloroflexota bacterium]